MKVTLPIQVPVAFPTLLGNEKETGLPKDSPVMEEMSPFTLWNEGDSFCQTTVPPVGMDKAEGVKA